jgi:hypothetical protein
MPSNAALAGITSQVSRTYPKLNLVLSPVRIQVHINTSMASTNVRACSLQQLLCVNDDNIYYCLDVPDIDSFECSLLDSCWCPIPKAEPDIAGIGVSYHF